MKPSLILSFAAGLILFAACSPSSPSLNQNEIDARVDSLVGVRMESLQREAMEDLDRRIAIEVKAKADSIVAAMRGQ